jgi:hypothetical protein
VNLLPIVPALLTLPRLAHDAMLFLSLLGILVALAVGGRATLAWLALARHRQSADRLTARLEAAEPELAGRITHLRGRLRKLNGDLERGLWALPAVDRRVAVAADQLGQRRAELDRWRGSDGAHLRHTATRIRGTLGVVHTALKLRRTIWR